MKTLATSLIATLSLLFALNAASEPSMTLSSRAFASSGAIPKPYTCDGKNVSPPLAWSGAPAGTRSFALIVDDPDAQDFSHWIVFNIPVKTSSLPEGATAKTLPSGAKQGSNDFGAVGYGGPCPPQGRHRYSFRIYALDLASIDAEAPSKEELEALIKGHILSTGMLAGTYQR